MNCDLKRKKSYSIYFDLSVDDNTPNYNCCERCVDLCTPIPRKFLFPTGALPCLSTENVFTNEPPFRNNFSNTGSISLLS